MPSSSHPQAQFVPISPEFDLEALVDSTNNFDFVTRLSTAKLKEHSIQSFEALVLAVVIQSGKPLVIEDWGASLPPWLFSRKWLEGNLGTKPEKIRDIPNGVDIPMTMGHYLRSMDQLTRQFTASTYKDPKRQRLYMKDIDCPEPWADHLQQTIPECVYYLNDCMESRTGGDGAIREPNEYGQMVYGKGVAPAGDLMSSLPPEMRAENMMCYVGHEGTYTPAHREMCASLGHNIMVEASADNGREKAGSSIWFMTETKERELVSEFFLSMLGHDVEVEKHFAQVNAWKKAPFNVWVVEQRVGDLILIPPLAPHQVWNRGTRTIKAAWNRTTVDTLELALHEALPRARLVCRDEQYKCKAIIYYTLQNYYDLLQRDTVEPKMWKYGRIKQLLEDFKRLFLLYQEVLVSEMFSPKMPETDVEFVKYDSNVTCSYCRCSIFNRFLTCKSCILYGDNGEEDTYDVCMDCYAMGRSCACISNLSWVEQWDWSTLVQEYERWRNIVVQFDGYFDKFRSPQPIDIARKHYGKRPIAEVCQEQLKLRPWTDITKPKELTPEMSDIEPEVDDEGRLKTRRGGKKQKMVRRKVLADKDKTHSCHICFHQEWNWKLAFCTTCNLAYCYGVLWRAFDLMPQTVMEDKEWECPRCLKICSCSKCRKGNVQTPYQPKGTLLGHDTRKVADYRSVESLVDFSKTNLTWLRDENTDKPHESVRMQRLKEKAEADKARVDTIEGNYIPGPDEAENGDPLTNGQVAHDEHIEIDEHTRALQDIDPELRGEAPLATANGDLDRTLFDPTTTGENGVDQYASHANGEEFTPGWMDGHYDLDDIGHDDQYNRQTANYPTGLFAPIVNMVDPESSYPEPSHITQPRMMGIGYYQQGNGVDQIIYDSPDANGSFEEPQPAMLASNPNLAFSDLLPQIVEPDNSKKRRKIGVREDDDDVEFFTSKRQKLRAQSKKNKQEDGDIVSFPERPEKRPPRRSVGQPKIYTDLGEDAVPIEEDEGPSSLVPRSHERKSLGQNADSDLGELAAQAMRRINKPKSRGRPPKEESEKRKGLRTQDSAAAESPLATSMTPKAPRKSAWLARKVAQEAGLEIPEDVPERTCRSRGSINGDTGSTSIHEISSDSENEYGSGMTIDSNKDSLFGEPIERYQSVREESERPSESANHAQTSEPAKFTPITEPIHSPSHATPQPANQPVAKSLVSNAVSGETPPKRRGRGRPPKSQQLDGPTPMKSPAAVAPAVPKLLSLKEKLALKGKSFRIVAKKQSASTPAPPVASGSSTPSVPETIPKSILKTPVAASPAGFTSVNGKEHSVQFRTVNVPRTSVTLSARIAPAHVTPKVSPLKKGPTVVRLDSPESEPEQIGFAQSDDSETDESSSDESIPAIRDPKKAIRGGSSSLRGRGRPRGMTARRGRPS